MNIVFVCNEYPPSSHGGIGTFTQVLARALVRSGHQIRVLGYYPRSSTTVEYKNDQGVQVWRISSPASRGRWILGRYRLFQRVSRWAKMGEIDLVEVPDYEGAAAFWPQLNVPVICRVHGSHTYISSETGRTPSRQKRLFEKRSICRADFWCSVSQHTGIQTQRLFNLTYPAKATLYNPIEVTPATRRQQVNPNLVVFAGTLSENKGIVSLIKAWSQVVAQQPTVELQIFGKDSGYGGGSMREYLISLLPTALHKTVIFHGHVPRQTLLDSFTRARVAVFPSFSETFGIAPFEAMSQGCPTIYTKRLPGPELITDGINGLLVEPGSPGEIASAIIRLLKDDVLADSLGRSGHSLVRKKYSLEAIVPQNIRFYEECIANFTKTG